MSPGTYSSNALAGKREKDEASLSKLRGVSARETDVGVAIRINS